MNKDQFDALIDYIDAKAAEAQHAAMHGGSVSTQSSEFALAMLMSAFSLSIPEFRRAGE